MLNIPFCFPILLPDVRCVSLYFLQSSIFLFFWPSLNHWHQTLSALLVLLLWPVPVVSLLSSQESDQYSICGEPSHPLKECNGKFGSFPFSCTVIVFCNLSKSLESIRNLTGRKGTGKIWWHQLPFQLNVTSIIFVFAKRFCEGKGCLICQCTAQRKIHTLMLSSLKTSILEAD